MAGCPGPEAGKGLEMRYTLWLGVQGPETSGEVKTRHGWLSRARGWQRCRNFFFWLGVQGPEASGEVKTRHCLVSRARIWQRCRNIFCDWVSWALRLPAKKKRDMVGCPGPFEIWLSVQGPRLLLALRSNTLQKTAEEVLLRLMVGCPGPEAGMVGCPGPEAAASTAFQHTPDYRSRRAPPAYGWVSRARGCPRRGNPFNGWVSRALQSMVGCPGPLEVWLGVQGPRLLLALLPQTLRITAADTLLRLMVGCPGSSAASTASQHTPDYRSRRAPPAYGWESRAPGWQRRRNPWDRPQAARWSAPAPLPPRTATREALQRPGPSLSTA